MAMSNPNHHRHADESGAHTVHTQVIPRTGGTPNTDSERHAAMLTCAIYAASATELRYFLAVLGLHNSEERTR
jgi:hypothetical protein